MKKSLLFSIEFIVLWICLASNVNAQGVGIGVTSPLSTLDVAGSFATRTTSFNLSASGLVTVGNSSHIVLTSIGALYSNPWTFTISDGQPGQYLIIELVSGYAKIQNIGNVKLSSPSALFRIPYSTLSLKWDGTVWVELARNSNTTSYMGKQVFSYTGSNQSCPVPSDVTSIFIKMWGAGGGGGYGGTGGSGAFVSGSLTVTPSSTLTVIVGGAGVHATTTSSFAGGFGGGGATGSFTSSVSNYAGSGGGRSAVQLTPGTDAATAGGGGGGTVNWLPNRPYGGGGGAPNGADGGDVANGPGGVGAGKGGTTSAGGAPSTGGSANSTAGLSQTGSKGANSTYGGGGGGGGYFGGSGGAGNTSSSLALGGGGGGSSFLGSLTGATNIAGPYAGEYLANPPANPVDVDYISGISVGAAELTNGGNGLVVIYW